MNDHIAKPIKPPLLYKTLACRLRPNVDLNGYPESEKARTGASRVSFHDLPSLEGLDLQAGLGTVNNDWNLYKRLLDNFYSRHQDIEELLKDELQRGDLAVAQRLAHTIKGLAGTIGANKLSEISTQLESSLKNEESERTPDLLERFGNEIERVMSSLEAFFENEAPMQTDETAGGRENESQPAAVLAVPQLKRLFQQLSEFIEKRDSDAIKLVAEIRTLLDPSGIGDHFLKLESEVNRFRFELAKESLEQATKELDL